MVAPGGRDLDGGDPPGRGRAAVQHDVDVVVADLGVAGVVGRLLAAQVGQADDAQWLAVDVVGLACLGQPDGLARLGDRVDPEEPVVLGRSSGVTPSGVMPPEVYIRSRNLAWRP